MKKDENSKKNYQGKIDNLENELDDLINLVEETEQINVEGVRSSLEEIIEKYELDVKLYQEMKSYFDNCKKAIEERKENRFDDKTGILNKLNEIKEEYYRSLKKKK